MDNHWKGLVTLGVFGLILFIAGLISIEIEKRQERKKAEKKP
jgi:hypothetical protein